MPQHESKELPAYLHFASQRRNAKPISHLGQRYDHGGIFLRERGNTVVCHLLEATRSTEAVLRARDRLLSEANAKNLAFTAASSLHMTLFQGIIETRRALPFWPQDVPLETPVDDMTAIFMDRLAGFTPGERFAVEVTHVTPCGLTLDGVTPADRARLRSWRDRFADLLGYRHPDHETYAFHITFAYLLERFDEEVLVAWVPFLEEVQRDLRRHAPVIELRPPAFCAFDDMNHFEELIVFEPK